MSDSREEGTQRPQMHPVSGISVVCWQKIISVITNWKKNVCMKGGIFSVSACLRFSIHVLKTKCFKNTWKITFCQFRRICCLVWYELKTKCLHERKHVSFSLCSPESRYLKSTRRGQWLKYIDNWITYVIELIKDGGSNQSNDEFFILLT